MAAPDPEVARGPEDTEDPLAPPGLRVLLGDPVRLELMGPLDLRVASDNADQEDKRAT